MKALWAPLEIADFEGASKFYGDVLGLKRVDTWQRTGERGAVFEVGESGRIEIVSTADPASPPRVALEVPTWAEVDNLRDRVPQAGAPTVFPRGHYGFVARDPDGNSLLIWSER